MAFVAALTLYFLRRHLEGGLIAGILICLFGIGIITLVERRRDDATPALDNLGPGDGRGAADGSGYGYGGGSIVAGKDITAGSDIRAAGDVIAGGSIETGKVDSHATADMFKMLVDLQLLIGFDLNLDRPEPLDWDKAAEWIQRTATFLNKSCSTPGGNVFVTLVPTGRATDLSPYVDYLRDLADHPERVVLRPDWDGNL